MVIITVSPGAIVISWLTEGLDPPIGSAMNLSVVNPLIIPGGTSKVLVLWPGTVPSRMRCELRSAYTVMSVKPWLLMLMAVASP